MRAGLNPSPQFHSRTRSRIHTMAPEHIALEESTLLIPPILASKIGLKAASFLQQLHYWLKKCKGFIDGEGIKWIYNTYEQWQVQLPFLSFSTLGRVIRKLKQLDLIKVERRNDDQWDQTNWYAINYEALETYIPCRLSNCTTQGNQIEEDKAVNLSDSSIDTENTPENTSNIEAEVEKSFPQEELTVSKLVEKYCDLLKFHQVYPQVWRDDILVENPLFKPVLTALAKVPPLVAERGIQSFFAWMRGRTDKEVQSAYGNRYNALVAHIRRR